MNKSIFFIFLFCQLFVSCSRGYQQFVSSYAIKAPDGRPDYSNLDFWAAHPFKKDPSDSLPAKLARDYHPDTTADVFFIYPTSYSDPDFSLGFNAPIDNEQINAKTDYNSILYQASVFNAAGRVFSPRYRQANYWCYFTSDTAAAKAAFQLAYADVRAAFEYYMAHYNRGRPIIIASHSQGTTHALTLLKEFFDGQPLQKQLVAAYLVGMPVAPGYFSALKSCDSPGETGCFCSWRTMKNGYMPDYVKQEKFTAVVTNPLTWSSAEPEAGRNQNPGAVLRNFRSMKAGVTNAVVHEGVLWVNKPRFFGNVFLHLKNYHIADYNFFYLSVRQNALLRVQSYRDKK